MIKENQKGEGDVLALIAIFFIFLIMMGFVVVYESTPEELAAYHAKRTGKMPHYGTSYCYGYDQHGNYIRWTC